MTTQDKTTTLPKVILHTSFADSLDKILIPRRLLEIELRCPICLDIISKTVCVKECLHRFCNSCLEESLRKNGKICPICRIEILTRRHTRLDPLFDAFIQSLNIREKNKN